MQTAVTFNTSVHDRLAAPQVFANTFPHASAYGPARQVASIGSDSAPTRKSLAPSEKNAAKNARLRHIATALGLTGGALLLHKLPAQSSSIAWLSSDWKDWARMALGIGAVDHINKGFQWKPPPWLLGLQSVVALNLVSHGPLSAKGWRQLPLLAVFVPALVQATHMMDQWVQKKLNQQSNSVPSWLPKTLISVGSTVAGILLLRRIIQLPAYQRFSGQGLASGSGQVMGAEAIVCSRCGGAHLVCMSEISDMMGSLTAWFKGYPSPANAEHTREGHE